MKETAVEKQLIFLMNASQNLPHNRINVDFIKTVTTLSDHANVLVLTSALTVRHINDLTDLGLIFLYKY